MSRNEQTSEIIPGNNKCRIVDKVGSWITDQEGVALWKGYALWLMKS